VVVLYIRIRQSPRPLVKRQDKRNIMPSYHCLGLFINCDRYKPFYCSTILYFEQYIHSHFVFLYQNNSFFFCRLEVYHRLSPPESLWLIGTKILTLTLLINIHHNYGRALDHVCKTNNLI